MGRLEIIYKNYKELRPYPNNPRLNDDAVDALANSIKEYGFKVPLVIDRNNIVICGHTRLKACERLGIEDIPCIVADDLTEEQARAFRIADNRTSDLSIWDNKLLLEELESLAEFDVFTGFDLGEIPELDIMDEEENGQLEEYDKLMYYELVCRSADLSKIERIKKAWEEMGGNDG